MNCTSCGTRMECIDSRDTATKTFGSARRRRYKCACGKRYSSAEILIGPTEGRESISVEVALRNMADVEFKGRVRTLANAILNEAGGK